MLRVATWSFGFRRERIVRERPSFIDTKGRAFGLRNQWIDVSATECRLCFRPKCLICGDDILASSTCCCRAASLYSFNVARSLRKVPVCLEESFTCVLQRLVELTQDAPKQTRSFP